MYRYLIALILIIGLYFSGGLHFIYNTCFNHNINIVVSEKLIRSAQMSREDLIQTIAKYKIKTVVDLRLDDDASDKTGMSEEEATKKAGANYLHAPLSSKTNDQKERVLKVLNYIKSAEPPILVHCSDGVHRAGFFAALWLMLRENASQEQVMDQLTFKYGFLPIERRLKEYLGNTRTLDRLLTDYYETKKESQTFEDWYSTQK